MSHAHLVIVLEYLVDRAADGHVSAVTAAAIDKDLPPYEGIESFDVIRHALQLGLLTGRMREGVPHDIRISAPALQLLGLDAERVFGSRHDEMDFVLYLHQIFTDQSASDVESPPARLWRAAASVIEFLRSGSDMDRFLEWTSRPFADPHQRHSSEMFWSTEVDVGVAIARDSGLIERSDPTSEQILDYRVTVAGLEWLLGGGAAIAKSVREIELEGILL